MTFLSQYKSGNWLRKLTCWTVIFTFVISLFPSTPIAQAQIPVPSANLIGLTSVFQPVMMKGMTIHPENPLLFDFIVHPGDELMQGEAFKTEANKLIKYFMASLTVPEKQMWVNLSPYEKNRIIPDSFGQTEMGRDLLAQDYMLKQLTASLMFPENKIGSEFWNRVYQKAQEKFGTTEIPMNTFNKIWIVPEKAEIYVNGKNVFVVNSKLKVMLEEDYLALEANKNTTEHGLGDVQNDNLKLVTGVNAQVVREILIPEIEREVNKGKTFANLRQIYNAVILATWYKKNLKQSLLGQVYVDQDKIAGVNHNDPKMREEIYNQYVDAFKKGTFDVIKDEYDPATQSVIPHKYFSGGVDYAQLGKEIAEVPVSKEFQQSLNGSQAVTMTFRDAAMFGHGNDADFERVITQLQETLKPEEAILPKYNGLIDPRKPNPYFRRTLWYDLLNAAEKAKIWAHGTANYRLSGGGYTNVTLSHRWALLGIMLRGVIEAGNASTLSQYDPVESFGSSPYQSHSYGPFYVVVKPQDDVRGLQRQDHYAYLIPDDREKQFFIKAISLAQQQGDISEAHAQDVLSKLITFKEFVGHADQMSAVAQGVKKPAEILRDEAMITDEDIQLNPFSFEWLTILRSDAQNDQVSMITKQGSKDIFERLQDNRFIDENGYVADSLPAIAAHYDFNKKPKNSVLGLEPKYLAIEGKVIEALQRAYVLQKTNPRPKEKSVYSDESEIPRIYQTVDQLYWIVEVDGPPEYDGIFVVKLRKSQVNYKEGKKRHSVAYDVLVAPAEEANYGKGIEQKHYKGYVVPQFDSEGKMLNLLWDIHVRDDRIEKQVPWLPGFLNDLSAKFTGMPFTDENPDLPISFQQAFDSESEKIDLTNFDLNKIFFEYDRLGHQRRAFVTLNTKLRKHGFDPITLTRQTDVIKQGKEVVNIVVGGISEDRLSLLQTGAAYKNVNLFFPEEVLEGTVDGVPVVAARPGLIFRDGKAYFLPKVEFLPVHYFIDADIIDQDKEIADRLGVPQPERYGEDVYTEEKDISSMILEDGGVTIPKWKSLIVKPHEFDFINFQRENDSNVVSLIRSDPELEKKVIAELTSFLKDNGLEEAVIKPNSGAQGYGVVFFNTSNVTEQAGKIIKYLKQGRNYIIQERIYPPLINDVTGARLDYNFRVFVSIDEHGKPKVYGKVARVDMEGKAVNLSQSAKPWLLEKIGKELGLKPEEYKQFEKAIDESSAKALQAVNNAMIRDRVMKPGENSSDHFGADIIVRKEGDKFVAYVIEVNDSASGAMWDLDQALKEQGPAFMTSDEIQARLGEANRGFIETAIRRGTEYKNGLEDRAMTSKISQQINPEILAKLPFNPSQPIFTGRQHSAKFKELIQSFSAINWKEAKSKDLEPFKKIVQEILSATGLNATSVNMDLFIEEFAYFMRETDFVDPYILRYTSENFARILNHLSETAIKNGYIFLPILVKEGGASKRLIFRGVPNLAGPIINIKHVRTKPNSGLKMRDLFVFGFWPTVNSNFAAMAMNLPLLKDTLVSVVPYELKSSDDRSPKDILTNGQLDETKIDWELTEIFYRWFQDHEHGHMLNSQLVQDPEASRTQNIYVRDLGDRPVGGISGIEQLVHFMELVGLPFPDKGYDPTSIVGFLKNFKSSHEMKMNLWEFAALSFSFYAALQRGEDIHKVLKVALMFIRNSPEGDWNSLMSRIFWFHLMLKGMKNQLKGSEKEKIETWMSEILQVQDYKSQMNALLKDLDSMDGILQDVDLDGINQGVFKQIIGLDMQEFTTFSTTEQSRQAWKQYVQENHPEWGIEMQDAAMTNKALANQPVMDDLKVNANPSDAERYFDEGGKYINNFLSESPRSEEMFDEYMMELSQHIFKAGNRIGIHLHADREFNAEAVNILVKVEGGKIVIDQIMAEPFHLGSMKFGKNFISLEKLINNKVISREQVESFQQSLTEFVNSKLTRGEFISFFNDQGNLKNENELEYKLLTPVDPVYKGLFRLEAIKNLDANGEFISPEGVRYREATENDFENVGGIDLNPQNIQFNQQGEGMDFAVPSESEIRQFNHIQGFQPIIINIAPVTNIPLLLGIHKDETDEKLLSKI